MFIASFYTVWRYKLPAVMLEVSSRGRAYAYTLRNVDIHTDTHCKVNDSWGAQGEFKKRFRKKLGKNALTLFLIEN